MSQIQTSNEGKDEKLESIKLDLFQEFGKKIDKELKQSLEKVHDEINDQYTLNPPKLGDPRREPFLNFYIYRRNLENYFDQNDYQFKTFLTHCGIRLIFVPTTFPTEILKNQCKDFIDSIEPFKKVVDSLVKEFGKSERTKSKAAIAPAWLKSDGELEFDLDKRPAPYSKYYKITKVMHPEFSKNNLESMIKSTDALISKKSATHTIYVKDSQYKRAEELNKKISELKALKANLEYIKLNLFVKYKLDLNIEFYTPAKPALKTLKVSAVKKNLFKQLTHSGIVFIPYDPATTQFLEIAEQKSMDEVKGKLIELSEDFKIKIDIPDDIYEKINEDIKRSIIPSI